MKKERITLKSIAEELGLSVTTVSKAMRDYPDISKETKQQVRELAEKKHYSPNSLALNLRKNKSNIIGVIIPEIVHFFFSSVINGIMKAAEHYEYSVLLVQSGESMTNEKAHTKLLFSTHVDGILAALSNETDTYEHFNIFQEFDIPVVMYDKVTDKIASSTVTIDDLQSAFQSTEHLIHQQCKRIVHLGGPSTVQNANDRYEGYRKACSQYGLEISEELNLRFKTISRQDAYRFISDLIQNEIIFDGIFCGSDILAVGALEACLDHNINVPGQVAIIGFSDSDICEMVRPQLSSVAQPGYDMGYRAAEILIRTINTIDKDEKYEEEHVQLPTHLKIRTSSNRMQYLLYNQ